MHQRSKEERVYRARNRFVCFKAVCILSGFVVDHRPKE